MKTAISLPDALSRKADELAESLGLSRSELYRRALAEFIEEHAPDDVTRRLDEVYGADDEEPAFARRAARQTLARSK